MESASTMVIKVNYGDTLRRFSVPIIDEKLNLDMDGLREKILSRFSIGPDTELVLTYIDEDGDVVTLVDADDLCDVVKQGLNPLRITVKMSSKKHARQFNRLSGVQKPLRNLNAGVSRTSETLPEPLCETVVKPLTDLTSKEASSAPGTAELLDYFSRVGQSYLGELSESQSRVHPSTTGDVLEGNLAQTESKDLDLSKVKAIKVPSNGREERSSECNESLAKLQAEAAKESNEVTPINVTGGSKAVSSGLDSIKVNVGNRENVKKTSECYLNGKSNSKSSLSPTLVNQNLFLEKKYGESSCMHVNLPSVGNNGPTDKEVNEPSEPHSGPRTASNESDFTRDILDERMRGIIGDFRVSCPSSIWAPDPHSYRLPYGKISATQSGPISQAVPLWSSISQDDSIGIVFHQGIRCDGCGMHPIIGSRFKSKVNVDYDLCSICFSDMGNGTDYIRMERPAFHQNHVSFMAPNPPNVCRRVSKKKSNTFMLDSRFVRDVNVTDGNLITPLTPFTKIWRMRNNGTVVWPQKTQLVWIGGERLSIQISVELEIPAAGLAVDQELDIAVDCISPERPGSYISYWRMVSPSGQKFGQRVWVHIQVDDSSKETLHGSIGDLNLNLLPDMGCPINNRLLVGSGASSSIPCAGPSASPPAASIATAQECSDLFAGLSFPNPIIHMLDPRPAAISSSQDSSMGKEKVEDKHLRELDMGSGYFDYGLEQTMHWDAILKELQEMGFHDTQVNKMLLKKNNGSIKRVVMDLISMDRID